MKKVLLFSLIVIGFTGIYFLSRNFYESPIDKEITVNNETTKKIVYKTDKKLKKKSQEPVSTISKENEDNKLETSKKINTNNIYNNSFWAENVEELVNWIKNADSSDTRKHFLEYARNKKKILVVESKNGEYKLNSIMVQPDYEYMTYTFSKRQKYICFNINLSDSMKQQMFDSEGNNAIEKVVTNYNKELKKKYKNFQYKKDEIKILNEKIPVYYNDGKYYEKLSGEIKLISPGVFFEIDDIEVRMTLYAELKEEKWDNKYLKLFKFKVVELT